MNKITTIVLLMLSTTVFGQFHAGQIDFEFSPNVDGTWTLEFENVEDPYTSGWGTGWVQQTNAELTCWYQVKHFNGNTYIASCPCDESWTLTVTNPIAEVRRHADWHGTAGNKGDVTDWEYRIVYPAPVTDTLFILEVLDTLVVFDDCFDQMDATFEEMEGVEITPSGLKLTVSNGYEDYVGIVIADSMGNVYVAESTTATKPQYQMDTPGLYYIQVQDLQTGKYLTRKYFLTD